MTATSDLDVPGMRAAIAALPAYVPGRRSEHVGVARLASNESHFDPLPSVMAAVEDVVRRLNRYPDPGAVALRERLAAEVGVPLDHIAVGPGSSGVLHQLIIAVCDPGDEVVHAWRSFEAYPILARLAGAVPVAVPLAEGGVHDLDAMAAAVTERTRLILLCTPNNPTGVALGTAEVERFLGQVPPHVLVAIDEAYVEYDVDGLDGLAILRRHPNVCLVRTFSKAHGLAALRLGYAVARPEVAEAIRRTMLTFAVTDLAQVAGVASLDARAELGERVGAVVAERERMLRLLRNLGWETTDSRGNFVWLPCSSADGAAIVEALDAAGVLVRAYADAGVRITVGDRVANDRVLTALTALTPPTTDRRNPR